MTNIARWISEAIVGFLIAALAVYIMIVSSDVVDFVYREF